MALGCCPGSLSWEDRGEDGYSTKCTYRTGNSLDKIFAYLKRTAVLQYASIKTLHVSNVKTQQWGKDLFIKTMTPQRKVKSNLILNLGV